MFHFIQNKALVAFYKQQCTDDTDGHFHEWFCKLLSQILLATEHRTSYSTDRPE